MSLVLLASYSRYSISRTGPLPTAILYRTFTVLDKHLTVCLNLSRNMTGHMRSLYVLCMIAMLFIHSAHFDFQGVLFFWDDFLSVLPECQNFDPHPPVHHHGLSKGQGFVKQKQKIKGLFFSVCLD